jgi:hypothetical protein
VAQAGPLAVAAGDALVVVQAGLPDALGQPGALVVAKDGLAAA